jgi:DNA processing protein
MLGDKGVKRFGVRIHRAGEYPQKLRDARYPLELLYYRGLWELIETPCIAVVGTRAPSAEGVETARKIVQFLVREGWTIVSGLAAGIDTVAHTTAIESKGKTIAVIGTPLSEVYPRSNADLQEKIAREYLLISQIPVYRYYKQTYRQNRLFFPERNVTMSALTVGTIIVEAGETSGTLIQARAALQQGRKVFIHDRCFNNPELSWPDTYAKRGAIRVRQPSDILEALSSATHQS